MWSCELQGQGMRILEFQLFRMGLQSVGEPAGSLTAQGFKPVARIRFSGMFRCLDTQ